jgi:hypothetical protein
MTFFTVIFISVCITVGTSEYVKLLISLSDKIYSQAWRLNTLLFADDQFIISATEDNLQQVLYLLHRISKEYNLGITTKKTKVFGFVGTDHLSIFPVLWQLSPSSGTQTPFLTDHLRTKIIINDETLEQVSQFTYLGCSISYQFSNGVEFKLAKFLQLIGAIKRTIFRKVRKETILKIYNTLVLFPFYLG